MPSVLAAVAVVSTVLPAVLAQVPLASQHFTYTALPYQADPNTGERGSQYGYNICNSTTEGPTSLCQTAIINSIDDFCLWGPPEPNSLIGNVEGESVAWCTKPGYGTRVIPKGAITGLQFIKTPDYVQVTGLIQQDLINIAADDSGGELDPHGADQRGNPLGGLLFSNAWGGGFTQAVEWHNFMGGGTFCLKACDPAGANAAKYCEHIFDRIGCKYNAPASYADGEFTSCDGASQDFPGIYTVGGVVSTYTQPPESLGAISTMPYEPVIPATSNCQTFQSSALFTGAPDATVTRSSSSSRSTGTSTRSSTRVASTTRSVSASSTGAPNGASHAVVSLGSLAGAALVAFFAL
ncbi:hypothetical protein FRC14_006642 [Serendipita sp. 396]|nr:hypothetical protein FRC14_006642 [Serendipita sp. 396]KAG8807873.1 hypothetical protein FRC19_006282 [Serendipita sp. 401]KAG9032202.1 hypothetical protein FS842_004121 [Serendipita sp. 407]